MTTKGPIRKNREIQYDYDNQAWIIDGVYQDCNHPHDAREMFGEQFGTGIYRVCDCYGREHKGERAPNIH